MLNLCLVQIMVKWVMVNFDTQGLFDRAPTDPDSLWKLIL
jgi:hypothetical protein